MKKLALIMVMLFALTACAAVNSKTSPAPSPSKETAASATAAPSPSANPSPSETPSEEPSVEPSKDAGGETSDMKTELTALLEAATAVAGKPDDILAPPMGELHDITENPALYLGLTAEQVTAFGITGASIKHMLMGKPDIISLIKCKDAAAATDAAAAIAATFDSAHEICAFPERSATLVFGDTVALVSSKDAALSAISEAFNTKYGKPEIKKFYEFE